MTQVPTVGRTVHYQSYGTPGGEYLPEARAAIITEVRVVLDTRAYGGLGYTIVGEGREQWIETSTGKRIPTTDPSLPVRYVVGLCVLNPTGQFFNRDVPYAEEPTPGHWNWPPLVDAPVSFTDPR